MPDTNRKSPLIKSIIVIAFVVLYFAVRIPFYSHPIIGEEGIFANLFFSDAEGPNYALIAKVNGQEVLVGDNHPAPIYETMVLAGKTTRLIAGNENEPGKMISRVRFAFSFFQLTVLIFLLLMVLKSNNMSVSTTITIAMAAVAITPLAFASSIQVRMDGSVGALMTGLATLALMAQYKKLFSAGVRYAFGFAAAFFLGAGRQEWSYPFIGAMVVILVLILWLKKSDRESIAFFAFTLGGCLAGNLASLVYDYANYMGGLNLLFSRSDTVSLIDFGVKDTPRRMMVRTWMVAPVFILTAFSIYFAIRKKEGSAWTVLLFPLFLFVVFLPGFISDYYYYRFFAPVLAPMLIVFAALFPSSPKRWLAMVIVVLFALSMFNSHWYRGNALEHKLSVTDGFGWPVNAYFPDIDKTVAESRENGCVPVLPCWTKYTHPKADFVIPSVGKANAEREVGSRGGRLCD